jgi:hypothetical protein
MRPENDARPDAFNDAVGSSGPRSDGHIKLRSVPNAAMATRLTASVLTITDDTANTSAKMVIEETD